MILLVSLACKPIPTHPVDDTAEDTGAVPDPQWKQVTNHPCAVATDGTARCWSAGVWAEFGGALRIMPQPEVPVAELVDASGSIFWGIDEEGRPLVFHSVFGRPTNAPGHSYPGATCTLFNGHMECWNIFVDDPYAHIELAMLSGTTARQVGVTPDGEWLQLFETGISPLTWERHDPGRPVTEIAIGEGDSTCGLFEDGTIECVGTDPPAFDNPPYQQLTDGGDDMCAARADDGVIECEDGSAFDFGPIRDFTVYTHNWYEWSDTWNDYIIHYGVPEDPPHVCAITVDNHIRCEGPLYDYTDLQDALP